jgi:hypothetical protein
MLHEKNRKNGEGQTKRCRGEIPERAEEGMRVFQRSVFRRPAHGAACGKAFFAQIFLEGVVWCSWIWAFV